MATIKDSGIREDYPSGMRRDTQDGKTNYLLLRDGPMLYRWAMQLTGGAQKYGLRNWQLANSEEELERFKASAARHFEQWLDGENDEDHAAATFFNINAAEYVRNRIAAGEWYAEAMEALEASLPPRLDFPSDDDPGDENDYRPRDTLRLKSAARAFDRNSWYTNPSFRNMNPRA